jgi:chromosome segregation ATPase
LREKEDELWDNLPLGDVEKLRGMLQVVSLYQQQLRENEGIIDDLHMRIESDDRTHRGLRRRFQQSQHGVIVVEEQEASLQQEHEQWARKGERYAIDDDIEALRLEHHNFQQELQALLAEAGPARNSLLDVQTRLKNSLEKQDHQRSALSEYEETCKNTLETMKVEHGAYCKDLRQAETSRLRSALANAQVHIRHLAKENQEVFEDLSNQRQEGARLQQQCAESREKVLELAAQVRAYLDEPRVAAQLGASLDGSMASMSFLPFLGDDPYHDVELESLRRQCKALERECQRTNDALERKQMECERWRARYLETRSRGPRSNFEVLHENHALGEAPAPFVLGPEPGTAEENLLLTPRSVARCNLQLGLAMFRECL